MAKRTAAARDDPCRRADVHQAAMLRLARRRVAQLGLLEKGDLVGHPLRRRSVLEIVIKELEITNRQVSPVGQTAQAVSLAGIRQQNGVFPVVTEGVVEVEAFAEA